MSDLLDHRRRQRTERQAATLEEAHAQLRHRDAAAKAEAELRAIDQGSPAPANGAPCATPAGGLSAGAIARSGLHIQPAHSHPFVSTRNDDAFAIVARHRDQILQQISQAAALAPWNRVLREVVERALDDAQGRAERALALTSSRSGRIRAAIRAEARALPMSHSLTDLARIVRGRIARRLDVHGLKRVPAPRTIRDELRTLTINAALSNRNDKSSA